MNRPREAVDVLSAVDPERGYFRQSRAYWDNLADAHLMLGELEDALEAIQRGRMLHPDANLLMQRHATALGALGHIEEVNEVLDELEGSGAVGGFRDALQQTPQFLRYYGYTDAAIAVAERGINWLETRSVEEAATPTNRFFYGQVLFLAGRLEEAQDVFDALVAETPNDRDGRMWRAFVAALRGDTAQALSDADALENLAQSLEGPARAGARWWNRGVIYGALGDHERAMELFREFQNQWNHGAYDHIRVLFEPLRDYEPFQEFLRPKG
jgi:tetratricopeptide (TPR) repeat protein